MSKTRRNKIYIIDDDYSGKKPWFKPSSPCKKISNKKRRVEQKQIIKDMELYENYE